MFAIAYEPGHCIICGHTDADVIADKDELRAEVEDLWAYHQKRLKPETPPARLMDRVAFSQHPPLGLSRCCGCGLVYRNPVEREREVAEAYGSDAPTRDVLRTMFEAQLGPARVQAKLLHGMLGRGSWSGLEVGSYTGAFLGAARDEGLHIEGIDINPNVNAFAREMDFTVHDGDLASFEAERERKFDVIAIWNTFDQLADPRAALHAARRLVRSGGMFVVRVPNGEFYARVRRRLRGGAATSRAVARALLAQNNLLGFPYRWGFTAQTLSRLLAEQSFTVCRVRGDVLVPTADSCTRRWARLEERVLKTAWSLVARAGGARAPWIEVYARRD